MLVTRSSWKKYDRLGLNIPAIHQVTRFGDNQVSYGFCVWLPYWQSLTADEKQQYLDRWQAPKQWLTYCAHINLDYTAWLDCVDDE